MMSHHYGCIRCGILGHTACLDTASPSGNSVTMVLHHHDVKHHGRDVCSRVFSGDVTATVCC
jgi:hypothetical protein